MPNQPTLQTANNHLQVAFSKDLGQGIRAVILQNGVVRFDFENYSGGGVFIYRYENSSNGVSDRLHAADLESREIEVQQFAFRLIQVHAVLLDNARRMLERCSSYTARPTEPTEMLRDYDVADPIDRLEPNFKDWVPLPDAVAQKSIEDLAKARLNEEGLFELLELYAFSLSHFLERRYAEALIAYWAVIEKSINVLWERMLSSQKDDPSIGLTGKRKDRLTNPNSFSASVMIETLFLLGQIPSDTYENLNTARDKRNKWMHRLQPVNARDALDARKVCEDMLLHTFAFEVEGTIGGGGGTGGGLFKEVFVQRYPQKAKLFDLKK